jgi:hypothetical protein
LTEGIKPFKEKRTTVAEDKAVQDYFETIETACMQYQIKYVPVAVDEKFEKILLTYLAEKQKFG